MKATEPTPTIVFTSQAHMEMAENTTTVLESFQHYEKSPETEEDTKDFGDCSVKPDALFGISSSPFQISTPTMKPEATQGAILGSPFCWKTQTQTQGLGIQLSPFVAETTNMW